MKRNPPRKVFREFACRSTRDPSRNEFEAMIVRIRYMNLHPADVVAPPLPRRRDSPEPDLHTVSLKNNFRGMCVK